MCSQADLSADFGLARADRFDILLIKHGVGRRGHIRWTEANGHSLHYARTMEIKELSVPVSQIDELKAFYRVIASDERNTAVLKPAGPR